MKYKSRKYYQSYYRLVTIAIVVMMAVLYGSLLIGDSVRGTLVDRVNERLGNAETIVTSGTGFMNDGIMQAKILANADAYLMCDGFVSSNGKLIPVYVLGCDKDSIAYGEALINEPLAAKLSDSDIVLHLPSHSLVPSGTLFVTQSYSTQLRLHVAGTKNIQQGGNLYLRNEQALPLNIFMNREELAEIMELEGKINLIMSPDKISEDAIASIWSPSLSGINVDCDNITTDRIFLQEEVMNTVCKNPLSNEDASQRILLAYLVNNICTANDSVPYSFVTAATSWRGEPLVKDEMIISDYAASRLGISVGDSVSMDYFVSKDFKQLETRNHSFIVKDIVPLQEIIADSLLSAEFPGLSNVERCADWDSDLPINMDKIQKIDEDYWYAYHQTPKAIVSYQSVYDDWSTSFGSATAIQVPDAAQSIKALTPQQLGIMTIQPREGGLYAATHGTDFSSLFLALGFFIILSGILLMQNPLVEMLTQRKDEIELYESLGFARRRIYCIFYREMSNIFARSVVIGLLSGLAYAALILFLLGNVWSGATHTEGFGLHFSVMTVIWSVIAGLCICFVTAYYAIRKVLNGEKAKTVKRKSNKLIIGGSALVICVIGAIMNMIMWNSIVVFVLCGLIWLFATGYCLVGEIEKRTNSHDGFDHGAMMWKTLNAQKSTVVLSFESLAVGIFTVFAVGLNRPDFSHSVDDNAITGGFSLWCDNRIPIEYDLNNKDAQRKLSLSDLPVGTIFMQCLKHTQDEASCLNLNKVSTPSVLGVALEDIALFGVDTLKLKYEDGAEAYPVLIDQEALIWSLMKMVGDTLHYTSGNGGNIDFVIAGMYPTGIFHGSAIVDKNLFRALWKEESGSKIFLAKTPKGKEEEAADLLAIALSQYGVNVQTTTQRIEEFFSVTDTYLAIFLTLGGLGMLIGIFSLFIVIRKNLVSRKQQLEMMRSLGYSKDTLYEMTYRENILVPVFAILSGAFGANISISANVSGAGWPTIITAVVLLIAIVAVVQKGIKNLIKNYINNLK